MDGLCCLLQSATLGDISINLQNSRGVSGGIAYQSLAALDENGGTILAGMDEFSLPMSILVEVHIDISTTNGKVGVEQAMGDAAVCFCAVQPYSSSAPLFQKITRLIGSRTRIASCESSISSV